MTDQVQELMAQLVMANYGAYANTAQQLIDNLDRQVKRQAVELDLIRARIGVLFNGPYMPTPGTVLRMLHVSEEEISRELASRGGDT